MPREIDSTWLTRPQLVSAFHEDLFASSFFKRATIVSLPDIQAETEPSGTCQSVSIGQEWEGRWRNLSAPATRVSDTRVQEQELVSFNPTCTRKTMETISLDFIMDLQEQHDTMTLCLPLWTKWQSMSMWFQQHQPLMQKVLLVFTSTMFSRCMAWASPLFQIEMPASRLPSLRKCLQFLVSSSGWAQPTTPKTDGQTERMNRVVDDTLRAFVNHRQTNWDELLPLCNWQLFPNVNWQCPFFLNSGQHPITPSTLVDRRTRADSVNIDNTPHNWLQHREEALMNRLAKDALTAAQARQAFYSDKGKTEMHLEVDDLVLIHRDFLITPEARDRPSDKLRPRWYGPFKVLEKVSSNAFQVDLPFQLRCPPGFQRFCPEEVQQECPRRTNHRTTSSHHGSWWVSALHLLRRSCPTVGAEESPSIWWNGLDTMMQPGNRKISWRRKLDKT